MLGIGGRFPFPKERRLDAAAVLRVGATRMKRAAAGGLDRRGDVARARREHAIRNMEALTFSIMISLLCSPVLCLED